MKASLKAHAIDSSKVKAFLQKNGYEIAAKHEETDLKLIRICGLTKSSEKNIL